VNAWLLVIKLLVVLRKHVLGYCAIRNSERAGVTAIAEGASIADGDECVLKG
jgi:hypothetical protein